MANCAGRFGSIPTAMMRWRSATKRCCSRRAHRVGSPATGLPVSALRSRLGRAVSCSMTGFKIRRLPKLLG